MGRGTSCRLRAGRVKGGFARLRRPLTRPDGEAAMGRGQEEVETMGIQSGCAASSTHDPGREPADEHLTRP